jgi:CMP-2-keto-3-deoxyoctulosonic acid synthetase
MPPTCSICIHAKRSEIDRVLLAGDSLRNIAKQFAVTSAALNRHKTNHLAQRLAQVAKRNEQADIRTAIDVVGQLSAINGVALSVLKEAREAGDGELALRAIDRIQKQIELQAKLIDLINDGDTVNIIIAPEWVQLRTVILAALHPYPDAAQAVAGKLVAIEGGRSHAAD